jgi:hypothetical protein
VNGNSENILVGGEIPLGNVVSGNGQNGIYLTENTQKFITYNTFGGLYAFGDAAPNGNDGLLIDTDSRLHIIGDATNTGRTNVFSGNLNNGIEITDNASFIKLESLIAGLKTNGEDPLPNGNNGVLLNGNSNNNSIGNKVLSVIRKNAISGNMQNGIELSGNTTLNKIFNNNIGTGIQPDVIAPNSNNGILLSENANNNIISNDSILANVIGNNLNYGVFLDNTVTDNIITFNYIGIDETSNPIPNVSGNFNSGFLPSNITIPNFT